MNDWHLALDVCAIALCVAGGVACYVLPERLAPKILGIACCAAGMLSLVASAGVLIGGGSGDRILWSLPALGPIAAGTTRLGALFAATAAAVYVPISLYTVAHLEGSPREHSARSFVVWYCLAIAAITGLFLCRDVTSFFVVWEIVAISSSALVACDWRRPGNARAAFVMLAMSEAGTIAALIAMLLARAGSGSLLFSAPSAVLGGAIAWAVFLLSFFGFGVKAGLLPVNSWLPRAYPRAPGSAAALLSGVVVNVGIYGIVLVNLRLAPVQFSAQGAVALIAGAATALVGILYATIEDDLKTMLAYSSIENMGIAVTALGAGFVFMAQHRPVFAAIGFAAGIYHVVNHSVYKALLFLGSATVDVKFGVRSMNRLGGAIRLLPATAALFLVGALSIAAIPPFNGFVSEWMTFQALLRSAELSDAALRVVFALAGAALALTAALAVTCFVKAFGMTFLGTPRSPLPEATEAARGMKVGMALLALECLLLGIAPTYVLPAIVHGLAGVTGAEAAGAALIPPFFAPHVGARPLPADFVATFHALGAQIGKGIPGRGWVVMLRGGRANPVVFAMSTTYLFGIVAVLLAIVYGAVKLLTRARRARRSRSWSGGLLSLLPEMTYTATGFSNPVRVVFDAVFNPTELQNERETVHEHFRSAIRRKREDVDFADRTFGKPLTAAVVAVAGYLARLHHGRLSAYVTYAMGTLIAALTIVSLTVR